MEVNKHQSEKFIKAQKRVKLIKQFYRHLKLYIIINVLLYMMKFILIDFFTKQGIQDEGFYSWLEWNAILWGIGLIIHGICVFNWHHKLKPNFMKDWEAKQMIKFLEEEDKNTEEKNI